MDYPEVVTFGEVLWDVLPTGKFLGGAPSNVAYRLSERGVKVGLISRVGDDEMGKELIQALTLKGVDCSYIQTDLILPTGIVEVKLNTEGSPAFDIIPGVAYDEIDYDDRVALLARKARVVCYGTLIQRGIKSAESLYKFLGDASSATKILDLNLRKGCYSSDSVKRSLEHADVVKFSRDEVRKVSEMCNWPTSSSCSEFSDLIFQSYRNVNFILVTVGEGGVIFFARNGDSFELPVDQVEVVDTIGSGDAFTAGFVCGLLKGLELKKCCEYGNLLGALASTKIGGMGTITDAEVRKEGWL
jgi:fructokinase